MKNRWLAVLGERLKLKDNCVDHLSMAAMTSLRIAPMAAAGVEVAAAFAAGAAALQEYFSKEWLDLDVL